MILENLINTLSYLLDFYGVLIASLGLAILAYTFYFKYHKSRTFINALPGLFTSLGVLGTFVAIYSSLSEIDDKSALNVVSIISKLIPAFSSSIAGLLCAFPITIVNKFIYLFEDKRLDDKVKMESPEECLFNISNKMSILSENIQRVQQLLMEQNENNKVYNDKLNTTISTQSNILETFINDFVKEMNKTFENMNNQIQNQVENFSKDQFIKTSAVLERMTQKMQELSGTLLKGQSNSMKEMVDNTNEELAKITGELNTAIKGITTNISSHMTEVSKEQSDKLEEVIKRYNDMSVNLSEQNSEFAKNMIEKLDEQKQQMADDNRAALEETKKATADTAASLRISMEEITNSFKEQVSQLKEVVNSNAEELSGSYTFISEHVADLKGNYESAVTSYRDVMKQAHGLNASQEKLLSEFNNSLKHMADTNQNVGKAIDVMDERQENIEKLATKINEVNATIEILQKLEIRLNQIAK